MAKSMKSVDDVVDRYTDPADSPDGRAIARKLLKDWFGALHHKDRAAIPAMMSDDIVIELPLNESGKTDEGCYRVYRGKEEVMGFWEAAFKAEGQSYGFTDTDLTINADGSRIFLEARGHLTMSSGKTYRNRYVFRFDIADGKIKHCKEYYNPIQSAYAFGRPIAGKIMLDAL
ncbi:MAG: nuclear transport factor 2 family protein [Hyphomonadaceae bacterium]